MKTIYQLVFQGTSFRDQKYAKEGALIRAGHLGLMFGLDDSIIYGFHPTAEAIDSIGGEDEAIKHLKQKGIMEGALFDDSSVFARACALAKEGAATEVWVVEYPVSDATYEQIRAQTITWYTDRTIFNYGFPPDEPKQGQDNCATFPRRLGLPTLDRVGQIRDVIKEARQRGQIWCHDEE